MFATQCGSWISSLGIPGGPDRKAELRPNPHLLKQTLIPGCILKFEKHLFRTFLGSVGVAKCGTSTQNTCVKCVCACIGTIINPIKETWLIMVARYILWTLSLRAILHLLLCWISSMHLGQYCDQYVPSSLHGPQKAPSMVAPLRHSDTERRWDRLLVVTVISNWAGSSSLSFDMARDSTQFSSAYPLMWTDTQDRISLPLPISLNKA